MQRILRENQALSLIPDENPEIAACFPTIHHTGSVADTMSLSVTQEELYSSTTDS